MKKKLLIGAALILSVGMACTSGAGDWQSYSGDKRIEERVDSVLALMTLEEKIGQMTQYSAKSDIVTGPQVNTDIEPLLKKGYIGSLFHATSSAAIRKTQETALAESRLKIPVLFAFDVIHGFKTIFPIPLGRTKKIHGLFTGCTSKEDSATSSYPRIRYRKPFCPMSIPGCKIASDYSRRYIAVSPWDTLKNI